MNENSYKTASQQLFITLQSSFFKYEKGDPGGGGEKDIFLKEGKNKKITKSLGWRGKKIIRANRKQQYQQNKNWHTLGRRDRSPCFI